MTMLFEDILRLVNYACAPVLTVAALYGLKQLSVARAIARMQAKRESFRLASEQCRYYLESIIALQNSLDTNSEECRKAINPIAVVSISSKGYSVSFKKKPDLDAFKPIALEFSQVFNGMESFAAFFTSGVAEERVAFNSVGITYCKTVRSYLPYLALLGAGENGYKNVMALFTMWNSRLEEAKLTKEKAALERRLESIQGQEIVTIGSE